MSDLDRWDLMPGYVGPCDECGEDVYDTEPCGCEGEKSAPVYFGPACYCLSRATRRVEDGMAGERECENGHRFVQRFTAAGLVSMSPLDAFRHDRMKKAVAPTRRPPMAGGASPQERPALPQTEKTAT